ncbi:MAG: hypothetical protein H6704_12590 [Myxococcales bacterium]|nr:hypothetical protein [Myxococcales bacterium]
MKGLLLWLLWAAPPADLRDAALALARAQPTPQARVEALTRAAKHLPEADALKALGEARPLATTPRTRGAVARVAAERGHVELAAAVLTDGAIDASYEPLAVAAARAPVTRPTPPRGWGGAARRARPGDAAGDRRAAGAGGRGRGRPPADGLRDDAAVLRTWMGLLPRVQRVAERRAALDDLARRVDALKDPAAQDATRAALALAWTHAGWPEVGLTTLRAVKDGRQRAETLRGILAVLVRPGTAPDGPLVGQLAEVARGLDTTGRASLAATVRRLLPGRAADFGLPPAGAVASAQDEALTELRRAVARGDRGAADAALASLAAQADRAPWLDEAVDLALEIGALAPALDLATRIDDLDAALDAAGRVGARALELGRPAVAVAAARAMAQQPPTPATEDQDGAPEDAEGEYPGEGEACTETPDEAAAPNRYAAVESQALAILDTGDLPHALAAARALEVEGHREATLGALGDTLLSMQRGDEALALAREGMQDVPDFSPCEAAPPRGDREALLAAVALDALASDRLPLALDALEAMRGLGDEATAVADAGVTRVDVAVELLPRALWAGDEQRVLAVAAKMEAPDAERVRLAGVVALAGRGWLERAAPLLGALSGPAAVEGVAALAAAQAKGPPRGQG